MKSESMMDVAHFDPGLALLSVFLLVGCERPLPETDKRPESGKQQVQQPATQPQQTQPQRLKLHNLGLRLLITHRLPTTAWA